MRANALTHNTSVSTVWVEDYLLNAMILRRLLALMHSHAMT